LAFDATEYVLFPSSFHANVLDFLDNCCRQKVYRVSSCVRGLTLIVHLSRAGERGYGMVEVGERVAIERKHAG